LPLEGFERIKRLKRQGVSDTQNSAASKKTEVFMNEEKNNRVSIPEGISEQETVAETDADFFMADCKMKMQ